MSFRTVNGSTKSENGWRLCNRDECVLVAGPNMNTAPLRAGPPAIILGDFARRYHAQVAPIISPVWAWSLNNDVLGGYGQNNGSNHLAATSIDINATQWPWGTLRMPPALVAKTNTLLGQYVIDGESGVFWGRVWGKPDEMHFQLRWREGDPRNDRLVAKILGNTLPTIPTTPPPANTNGYLQRGSTGPAVGELQAGINKVFDNLRGGLWTKPTFAKLQVDGDFGPATEAVVKEFQRRSKLDQDGVVGPLTRKELNRYGILGKVPASAMKPAQPPAPTPPPAQDEHRPIWIYSAAGTGGRYWQGPQHDSAEWCKATFNLNHQPLDYPAGGFLGLAGGGDPKVSYNDSILALDKELERVILLNPDLHDPDVEFWFFGYSQSADGLKRAVNRLFGDGGRFSHLRSRINGLVLFGDPTKAPGPTKVGNNPPGWGISRWDAPKWVDDLTWSITNDGDLYACATDDTLVDLFYPLFIRAETELPFLIYVAKIILPAIMSLLPIGGLLVPAAVPMLSLFTGVAAPLIGQLVSGIGKSDEEPDPELIKLLTLQGIIDNLPKLIRTLFALQGIATHGDYWAIKREFNNRSGVMVACDIVKDFRR